MPTFSILLWLAIGSVVVGFAALDVGLGAQAYLGIGAVAGVLVMYVLRPTGWLRFAILLFALFVSLRYIVWRYAETLPPVETVGFAIGLVLVLAETHGFVMHALGMFTNANPRQRKPAPLPSDTAALPTVDVFVPTYDEPVDLVRQTVIAATQLRYPAHKLRVHVLDDGGTDARVWANPERTRRGTALQDLCAATGATYRTRPDNRDAKAGNINEALKATSGELVLILDCDHIPTVDFLERTVGHFLEQPNLAFIQTPHFFRNPDPIERNLDTFGWMPSEGEMFYGHTLKGMDHWNAAFFCGSAALLSRRALEAVDGISTGSITEDADTALNMHAQGFDSLYVDRPMVAGVAPDTLAAFVQQRTRWCQGMLQILLLNNPLGKPGLRLAQRLSYLNSLIFWFFSLTRLTFLLAPLSFIVFDLEIIDATFPEFVAFIVPHIFVALTLNNFLYGTLRLPFVSDLYEAAQSLFLAPAVLAVLRNPRRPDWKVTPKNEVLTHDFLSQLALPIGLLLVTIAGAEAFAIWRLLHEPFNVQHLSIVLTWNTLNLIVVLAAFGATLEKGSAMHKLWMPVGTRAFARSAGHSLPALIEASNGAHGEIVIKRDERDRFVRGDRLQLTAEHGIDAIPRDFDAVVVNATVDRDGGRRYRIAFETSTIAAERALVATLYGSSDRWMAFQASRRHRRALLTNALALGVIGLRQLHRIAAVALRPVAPSRAASRAPTGGAAGAVAAVAIALLGLLLFSSAGLAQPAPAATASAAEADDGQARLVTLRALTRDGELPTLDARHSRAQFDFVVTPNVRVDDLALQLGWVSSPELAADPQGLELRLNGQLVDHLPIVPTGLQQDARVALPASAVRPGVNTLALVSRYGETLRCEDPTRESWTTFSAGQSFLVLSAATVAEAASLADLDRAGWRWGIADRGVTLMTTRTPDDALLTTGANLAGALSLRRDQPGLVVRHAVVGATPALDGDATMLRIRPEDLTPGLNVLFGTAAELQAVLAPELVQRIDRPVLGVQRVAGAPDSLVMILSGRTAAEVHRAAATLANRDLVLPDATWAELPQTLAPGGSAPRSVRSQTRYGFDTPGILQFDAANQSLGLTLPAGFVAMDNRKMELKLHYAHAPGLPAGAVLEVLVNGLVVRQLPLDEPTGALVRDRRVRLELIRFRPGANEIAFRAAIVGETVDACLGTPRDWVEVFADSELRLPRLVDVNRYPDLGLLVAQDSPMGQQGGRDLGIVVAAADPEITGAAWTLAARLAASQGTALPQLEVRQGDDTPRRHAIWVGPASLLDANVAAAAGLADVVLGNAGPTHIRKATPAAVVGRRSEWIAQLEQVDRPSFVQSALDEVLRTVGAETLWHRLQLQGLASQRLADLQSRVTAFFRLDHIQEVTLLPADRSFDAAVAGLPRYGRAGGLGTELYVVALDGELLQQAVADLVRTERWDGLQGTAAAWRLDGTELATATPVLPIEAPTEVSLAGTALAYANWLAGNPVRWFGIVVIGAAVIGTAVAAGLRREDRR